MIDPTTRLTWHRTGGCPGCGCRYLDDDDKPIAEGVVLCFCCTARATEASNLVILTDLAKAANL